MLFVDLLNLLAAGGAYAERMQALLDASGVQLLSSILSVLGSPAEQQ